MRNIYLPPNPKPYSFPPPHPTHALTSRRRAAAVPLCPHLHLVEPSTLRHSALHPSTKRAARGSAARVRGAGQRVRTGPSPTGAGSAGVRERGSERLRAAAIGCSVGPGEQQEPVKRRHTAEAAEDGVCVLLACCYGCRTACIPILRYLLVVRVPATCSLHLLLRAFVLLFA